MSVELIKGFAKWYDVNYAICYFYNVFGPGHDSSPVPGYESVISIFERQFKNNEALTVVGDGQQERMFTYVEDVVDGLIRSWHYEENDEFDLVNPVRSYKILEIANMFSNNIQFVESRKGDRITSDPQVYDDTCTKLNWKPSVTIEQWIKEFVDEHNISN